MSITDQLLKNILDQLVYITSQLDNIAATQRRNGVSESKSRKMPQKQSLNESLAKKRKKISVKQAVDSIMAQKIFDNGTTKRK